MLFCISYTSYVEEEHILIHFFIYTQCWILIAGSADALLETQWQAQERRYRQAVRDGLEDGEEEIPICEREGKKGQLDCARKEKASPKSQLMSLQESTFSFAHYPHTHY